MKHIEYVPSGVCSRMISFDLSDDGRIHNLAFLAGCPGNLRAISKLVEGQDAKRVAEILKLAKNEIKNLTKREIHYIIITGGLSELADRKSVV